MEERILYEIRCPFQRLSKKEGKLYTCNSLCGRMSAGSSGELRCRKCRLNFEFDIDDQAKPTIGVRVKKVEDGNI